MYNIIKIDNGTLLEGYYDQTCRSDFSHHKHKVFPHPTQSFSNLLSRNVNSALILKSNYDDRSLILKSDGISTLEERRSAR